MSDSYPSRRNACDCVRDHVGGVGWAMDSPSEFTSGDDSVKLERSIGRVEDGPR
jgi:hypothetical protein